MLSWKFVFKNPLKGKYCKKGDTLNHYLLTLISSGQRLADIKLITTPLETGIWKCECKGLSWTRDQWKEKWTLTGWRKCSRCHCCLQGPSLFQDSCYQKLFLQHRPFYWEPEFHRSENTIVLVDFFSLKNKLCIT